MAHHQDIRTVRIAVIIDWAIDTYGDTESYSAKNGFSVIQINNLRNTKEIVDNMSDMIVGDLDISRPTNNFQYKYKSMRFHVNSRKGVSDSTIRNDLKALKKAISLFAAEHDMYGVPRLMLKKPPLRVVTAISRADVARLLVACRGNVWDHTTSGWFKDKGGSNSSRCFNKHQRKAAERAILIAVYSGTGMSCIKRLKWSPNFAGDVSYVDLTTEIEGRTGFIMKLGVDVAQVRMAEVPIKMPKRLTAHMNRWFHQDGKRRNYVISRGMIGVQDGVSVKLMKQVFTNAGLADRIGFLELKDAAAVWALRAGSRTPKGTEPFLSKRSVVRSAALMRGMEYIVFQRIFGLFHDSFQRDQVEALENLADTVR